MLAFLVVFPFVFVFPPVGLMLFGLSLASLPFTWIIGQGLIASEATLALRWLDSGVCPQCANRMQTVRDEERPWQCEFCETRFRPDGRVISDRMVDDLPSSSVPGGV